jgi:hypothetical protein
MTLDDLFQAASAAVIPGWVLLIFVPRWKRTQAVVTALAVLLAACYTFFFFRNFFSTQGSFATLESVRAMFSSRVVMLVGWIHYLCFDLLIGAWEAREGARLGIPRMVTGPCLVLTLMLGPLGLLAFLIARLLYARQWVVE